MKYLFLLMLAMLAAGDALAVDYNHVVVVKEEWTNGWQSETPDFVPFLVNCRRDAFSARSPEAPISPLSNDPRVTTSDSSILYWPSNECNLGVGPDRRWTKYFRFNARSLKDLGQHRVVCDGYSIPASKCKPGPNPPCNIVCDYSYATIALPVRWFVNVINIPPEISPTYSPSSPAWNSTVTLNANGRDLDNPYPGETNNYRWSIAARPAGSLANLTNPNTANPTITFSGEKDLGTWRFRLEVDDNEGEIRIQDSAVQFTVPNAPPNFEISGPLEVVVHNPIGLGSSRTTDDDGGNLTFVWDILQTPAQSAQRPQNNYSTSHNISIPTTKNDIGEWVFRLTATDNEGAVVVKTVTVRVVNLKPRIVFNGPTEIDTGQNLLVSTAVLNDDDGGELTFKWEVVQEPGVTGTPLPYVTSTTSAVSKPSLWRYGTWIFRLTATDDEGESTQGEFKVLVDMGPNVFVSDVNGDDFYWPENPLIVNQFEYLRLNGSADDPDSPCTDRESRCHRTDGRPVSVSQGIVRYQWNIIDIPYDVNDRDYMEYYDTGPVSQYFYGIADNGPTLDFGFINIPEGLWGLELRVWDAEGNESSYPAYIQVHQEAVPPYVYFHATGLSENRATTPLSGVLPTEISFDGSQSRDPDNQDFYDPYYPMNWYPGMGITGYAWHAIPPTPQCNGPTLPASEKFVLYPAGATIPPSCQGRWRMRLTVSDDDRVTKTSTQEYTFAIGNCSGKVCLDSPRQLAPATLSTEGTGGTFIGYHIDSALYDETSFGLGVYTKLEIFIEDNTLNPIYSAVSGPATQTSRGLPIPLYWNGVTQSGTRVPEGKYFHVKISLLDANANVLGTQIEYRAITSEPMRAVFNEPSTKYVHSIGSGSISFTVTGVQNPVDSYRGILRDSAGNAVATFTAPASAITMSINYSTPGFYSFELFAIRGTSAISLGTHPLTIYKILLQSGVDSVNALDLEMLVNSDDDNLNGLPDMQEAFGVDTLTYGDDEVRVFRAYFQPRELAGTLTLEHTLGAGALKAWTTPTKAAEVTLPKAWSFPGTAADSPILSDYGYELYLEAHKEAKGEVRLVFTTMDGISLPKAGIPLSTVVLDAVGDTDNDHVIEDEDAVLRTLRPGRWDNAYDGAFNVRNNMDPDHFVDLDPSRFYLRAKGPKLDVDPSKADILQFSLTISHQVNYDAANIMRLPESGPNTAMMVSRSLMLTGTDIEGIPRADTDDGFPVHDGISKVVSDGAIGDRTWRAPIDAHLTVWYNQPNATTLQWRLPVCGAERRKLPLRIHVFLEPYQDVGFDDDGNPATPNVGALNARFDYADVNGNGQHDLGERSEPYVNLSDPMTDMVARSGDDPAVLDARGPLMPINDVWRELRHTDSLWSPACIKTEVVGGTILVEDAPSYNFQNILADGVMTEPEISQLYRVYNASMTEDVIEVFYGTTQHIGIAAAGLAFPPLYQTPAVPHGEKLFTIIKSGMSSYATLAHELAHLLTNTGDSAGNQTFFYPLNVPLTPLTTVNGGRRMPGWVATDARTVRPAGNLAARGNRQLQSY